VTAVATRFVAEWNGDRASIRDAFDLALEDAEFGRINEIVCEIDRD
jgi:hypothetical protein